MASGISPRGVHVVEPAPSDWLRGTGVHLGGELPDAPAVALIAVKPQMMGAALPRLQSMGNGTTLFVSIAAGTTLATLGGMLGARSPLIRAMPNTPAAVGRGITALIGNDHVSVAQMALAEALLAAVGQTLRLQDESQMDAVTAVSGSGPAYVFHLIEAMAAAGEAEGLPRDMALHLARATVAGAGHLAGNAEDPPDQLRRNVTSPGGTTAAALDVLMDAECGFPPLLRRAIAAAAARARALSE